LFLSLILIKENILAVTFHSHHGYPPEWSSQCSCESSQAPAASLRETYFSRIKKKLPSATVVFTIGIIAASALSFIPALRAYSVYSVLGLAGSLSIYTYCSAVKKGSLKDTSLAIARIVALALFGAGYLLHNKIVLVVSVVASMSLGVIDCSQMKIPKKLKLCRIPILLVVGGLTAAGYMTGTTHWMVAAISVNAAALLILGGALAFVYGGSRTEEEKRNRRAGLFMMAMGALSAIFSARVGQPSRVRHLKYGDCYNNTDHDIVINRPGGGHIVIHPHRYGELPQDILRAYCHHHNADESWYGYTKNELQDIDGKWHEAWSNCDTHNLVSRFRGEIDQFAAAPTNPAICLATEKQVRVITNPGRLLNQIPV
jgi:hypothetical protein